MPGQVSVDGEGPLNRFCLVTLPKANYMGWCLGAVVVPLMAKNVKGAAALQKLQAVGIAMLNLVVFLLVYRPAPPARPEKQATALRQNHQHQQVEVKAEIPGRIERQHMQCDVPTVATEMKHIVLDRWHPEGDATKHRVR